MLHPMQRCGDIVTETLKDARGRRLSKAARRREAIDRLAEVGITNDHVVEQYPFELSGGMRQRVAIAASLTRNPRLLIADEPSTALDVTTQQEVLALLGDLQRARGMALVLITHDLRVAFSVCQRINVLYAGSIAEAGPAIEVAAAPLHPYTLGLLLAEPPVDRRVQDLISIPGAVPTPDSVSGCCSFVARCAWAADVCAAAKPATQFVAEGRVVACHRHGQLAAEMVQARVARSSAASHHDAIAEPSTAELLAVQDLAVTYAPRGRRGAAVHALKGVSIAINDGESVGVVGESGSGKTTLGRSVVGLARPTSGSIQIGGIDTSAYLDAKGTEAQKLRRMVQIVFQDPYSSLNPVQSIGTALAEALHVRLDRKPRPDEVEALLTKVHLPASYADRKPSALSGGERQRVAIARAIAVQPRLLICDEPVSALDVSVQAQVLTLLRELREELGLAFLFVTHDLAVVRQIADRIYVMHRGEVVESGLTSDVMDHPKHAYTRRLIDSVPRSEASAKENTA
jgi:peptide/nickel transport system ATP-binding protein